MKHDYSTIETLFDLPKRLKHIDDKITMLSMYSYEEEDVEKLFNKIIDMKLLRNRVYNKYVVLVNTFNSLNKKTRNVIAAIFLKNMSVNKVANITKIKQRTIYRRFDEVENILKNSLKEKTYEQVL